MANVKTRAEGETGRSPGATASRRPSRLLNWRNLGEVLALVVAILVFALLNPGSFLAWGNISTILNQAAIPLIVGIGATLVILMGSIDLSVEGVMGAAGMSFVLLAANSRDASDLGWGAVVIGIAVGAAIGAAIGLIHTLLKVPTFIVSLGVWFVGLGIATMLFGQSSIPFLPDGGIKMWPVQTTLGLPNSFVLALVLVILGVLFTRFTALGRAPFAIGNNEDIARASGIPVRRVKVYIFAIAGGLSGVAGILATLQLGAGSATIGIGTLFLTVAAVVIGGTSLGGGKGGILRTAIGVMFLTVLNNGLILSGVGSNVQSAVSGVVLIAAIVVSAWPHRGRLRIMK